MRVLRMTAALVTCALMADGAANEAGLFWAALRSAGIWADLQKLGVPGIQGVWSIPEAAGWGITVVSIKQMYAGHAPQVMALAAQCTAGAYFGKYVIVVDDDVDPWNLGEVFHAICTKCNPIKDIHIYPGYTNSPLTPYITTHPMREIGAGGGNVLFDCTWPIDLAPADRPHRLAFKNTYPDTVKEMVLANFARWGLQRKPV